jgi:hypothetical protein
MDDTPAAAPTSLSEEVLARLEEACVIPRDDRDALLGVIQRWLGYR